MGAATREVLEWALRAFLPAKGRSRRSRADKAPGNDPQDHPPRRGRAGSRPDPQPLNLPRTKPVWGSGSWAGAGAGLSGGKCHGWVARQRALEEQGESRGERAALPSHQPPSEPPRLAPPALCSSALLLPRPGLGTREIPAQFVEYFSPR